jgi:hypothetical protein
MDLLSDSARRLLHVVQLGIERGLGRIEQYGYERGGWNELAQQPEPLCPKHVNQRGNPSGIATGPAVARHYAHFDWVFAARENDENGRRDGLGRKRSEGTACQNHRDLSAHQLVRQRRQSIIQSV